MTLPEVIWAVSGKAKIFWSSEPALLTTVMILSICEAEKLKQERSREEAIGREDVDTLMKLKFIIICYLVLSAWNTLPPETLLPIFTSLPRNFYLFFKTLTQVLPPLSLSILRSRFPLSLPPLLPSPSLGLHLPGTQMPSSRVICFAKILFWFDKLWPG